LFSARCVVLSGQRRIERGVDERLGRGRSDAGPDNAQEIVSKIRE
jgi:hypothetical protein